MAMIGVGVYAFCVGVNLIYLAHRSASWTEAEGRVIAKKVICSSSKGGVTYNPQVVYGYEVDGVVYYNNNYSYGFGSAAKYGFIGGRKEAAEESLEHYRIGSVVPVFYNPENPEQSCLKPGGLNWVNGLPIGLGAFFVVGVIWLWRVNVSHGGRTNSGRRFR